MKVSETQMKYIDFMLIGATFITTQFVFGSSFDTEAQKIRRYGLFIGVNEGGNTRPKLKYATTDAENFSKVMGELGGINKEDEVLLLNPNSKSVYETFSLIKAKIAQNHSSQTRSEFFVYYSGHSDDNGLLVGEERIPYKSFKKAIESAASDISVVIVDSCESGSLTRVKGGQVRPPFFK